MKKKLLISFIIIIVCLIIAGGILFLNIEKPFNKELVAYNPDSSQANDYDISFNENIIGEYVTKIAAEDIYSNKQEEESQIVEVDEQKEQISDDSSDKETKEDNKESKTNNDVTKINTKTNTNTKDNTKNEQPTQEKSSSQKQTTEQNDKTEQPTQEKTPSKPQKSEQTATSEKTTNSSKNNDNSYKEQEVQIATKTECVGNNHKINSGNTGRWFNTKAQAESYFDTEIAKWGKMWENDEIEQKEYLKKCPYGYEIWSCPQCQKWTVNFYYR